MPVVSGINTLLKYCNSGYDTSNAKPKHKEKSSLYAVIPQLPRNISRSVTAPNPNSLYISGPLVFFHFLRVMPVPECLISILPNFFVAFIGSKSLEKLDNLDEGPMRFLSENFGVQQNGTFVNIQDLASLVIL